MAKAVTVTLYGGLGNQLFQLCYGLHLKHDEGLNVKFSTIGLERWSKRDFSGKYSIEYLIEPEEESHLIPVTRAVARLLARRNPTFWLTADGPSEDLTQLPTRHTRFVSGYFQSLNNAERFWSKFERRVRGSTDSWASTLGEPIPQIAIHIRLGDYRSSSTVRGVHGLTQPSYYLKAAQLAASRRNTDAILLVSDEPDIAEELLGAPLRKHFKVRISNSNSTDLDDLSLLARSSVIIGSNSSFSWWAAFFATKSHRGLVILPDPWYASSEHSTTGLFDGSWVLLKRDYSAA